MNQWVFTGSFGLMWVLIAGSNWFYVWDAYRRGGGTSLTLFLGGVFGAVAVLVCPLPGLKPWAWLPALLDPGSLPALVRILRSARAVKNAGTSESSGEDDS
jgi:hypothetical protein